MPAGRFIAHSVLSYGMFLMTTGSMTPLTKDQLVLMVMVAWIAMVFIIFMNEASVSIVKAIRETKKG